VSTSASLIVAPQVVRDDVVVADMRAELHGHRHGPRGGPALLLDYYLSRYERRLHPQTDDDSVKPLHPAVSR